MQWAILALTIVFILAAELMLIVLPHELSRLAGLAIAFPVLIAGWLLNKRGNTSLSQLVLIYGFWAAITFGIAFHGGLRAPLAVIYPVLIFASGWLCSRTHLIVLVVLCCLAVAGFSLAEHFDILGRQAPAATAWQATVFLVAFAASVTAALYFRHRYQLRYEEVQSLAGRLADSEGKLRLITQHVPAMLLRLDRRTRLRFANQRLADFVGRPLESLDNQPLAAVFGPQTGIALRELADQVTASGQPANRILSHRPDDAPECTLEAAVAHHCSADGAIDGTLMLIRDITEQQRTLLALEEQRTRYAALLRAQADAEIGLLVIENERILHANEVVRRLFGYDIAEIGLNPMPPVDRFLAMVDAADRQRVATNLANRLLGGSFEKRFDVRIALPGQGEHILEITAAVMAAETAPRTLVMLTDVTERRQAEAQVKTFNEKLEGAIRARTAELVVANRDIEAFAYSISHELRTPLRAIDGYSHIIAAENADRLDAKSLDNFANIRMAAQRMGQLIDDMLMLANVSRSHLQPAMVDLSAMARTLCEELRAAEPQREVELRITEGCIAFCDLDAARVLLKNLLGNAWKFTGRTPRAEIDFGCERQGGDQVFFVRDNGAGFDMVHAARLFTPFVRLHAIRDFEGTGIGLASAARIIARHGGRIWADATVDRGATFSFTLPGPASLSGGD